MTDEQERPWEVSEAWRAYGVLEVFEERGLLTRPSPEVLRDEKDETG